MNRTSLFHLGQDIAQHSRQSAQKMGELLMVYLLAGIGLVTAEDLIEISGQLGSDLLLPVADARQFNGTYQFDIFNSARKHIGTYHDGFTAFKGYKDRLTYNKTTCNVILKNLTEQDGTSFTVILKKEINSKIKSHNINYRINISGPLTSPPYIEDTTQPLAGLTNHSTSQISTDGTLGFVSFCLSLDSPINAVFLIVLWIMQEYCKKLDKVIGDLASLINSSLTFLFQFVSICTMLSGNPYSLLLSLIPILLLVDILRSLGMRPQCHLDALQFSDEKKIFLYVWRGILLLIQMLFAIVVGILSNKFDEILRLESRITFIVSSIFIALKIGVLVIVYCCKTKPQFSPVPTGEAKATPGGPEGIV